MKKNKFLAVLIIVLILSVASVLCLVGCKPEDPPTPPAHTHTFAETWSSDATHHWHAATCEHTTEVSAKAEHTFENDVCTVCGYVKPVQHTHTFDTEWTYDAVNHWHAATCEHTTEVSAKAEHTFENDVCTVCGYVKPVQHTHTFDTEWTYDAVNHWHAATCEHITEVSAKAEHTFENDVCTVCGYVKPVQHTHTFDTEWTYDAVNHWHAATCEHITETSGEAIHNFVDGVCECGASNKASEGLAFTKFEDSDNYYVSKGTVTDSNVIIPEIYNGGFVTQVYDFTNCSFIESIKLPKSITRIAGLWGTSLTEITIPANVEEFGTYAFYNLDSLTTVTLEEGSKLKKIGERAFQSSGITSINLPEGLEIIDKEAFADCHDFTQVTLPSSLTTIGDKAFKESGVGDSTLIISENVTTIGTGAFDEIFWGTKTETTIHCVAESKPAGWAEDWFNVTVSNNVSVEWGYKPE